MESLQEKTLVELLFLDDNQNPDLKRLLSRTINFNTLTEDCVFNLLFLP